MKLLDIYIGRRFLYWFFLVTFILAVLFGFIEFLSELNNVGAGAYSLGGALTFVGFTLPRRLIDLMPISALLGGTIALGLLSDHGELLGMQAAGISWKRISAAVFATFVLVVVVSVFLAETIIPEMEQVARKSRAKAIHGTGVSLTQHGFWERKKNVFIHVDKMIGEDIASDINIFEFDPRGHLKTVTLALSANILNNRQWILRNVTQKTLTDEGITVTHEAELTLGPFSNLDEIATWGLPPYSMSTHELIHFIQGLRENGQNADQYLLKLWRKLSVPLLAGAMILYSLSFVFGENRSSSAGRRTTLASIIGLVLYFADQLIMHAGLLLNLNPLVTAMIPVAFVSGLAVHRLRALV